jgi:hypothetical protein
MSILFYLVNNDICLLCETKEISNKKFVMKDPGDTSFVLDISILRDFSQGIIQTSQKIYINNVENKLT